MSTKDKTNVSIKTTIINNIMLQMSVYIDAVTLDILQRVIEEQFVFLNIERITGSSRQEHGRTEPLPYGTVKD